MDSGLFQAEHYCYPGFAGINAAKLAASDYPNEGLEIAIQTLRKKINKLINQPYNNSPLLAYATLPHNEFSYNCLSDNSLMCFDLARMVPRSLSYEARINEIIKLAKILGRNNELVYQIISITLTEAIIKPDFNIKNQSAMQFIHKLQTRPRKIASKLSFSAIADCAMADGRSFGLAQEFTVDRYGLTIPVGKLKTYRSWQYNGKGPIIIGLSTAAMAAYLDAAANEIK